MTTHDQSTLAGRAGLNLWECEFCGGAVVKGDDYIQGLDGMRAHRKCVEAYRRRRSL